MEVLSVRCRPFYILREFTAVIIIAVYIPLSANANATASEAFNELYSIISELHIVHPDSFFIVAGDFNNVSLKSVLPRFYQNIDFATRENNMLDLFYINIQHAYKAAPLPHLGQSDHISKSFIPVYRLINKQIRPALSEVRMWPKGAISAPQDCFDCTDKRLNRHVQRSCHLRTHTGLGIILNLSYQLYQQVHLGCNCLHGCLHPCKP